MRNPIVYLWCKKIHRYFVIAIMVLTILMGGSGLMMHEGEYMILPAAQIRSLHYMFSVAFVGVLAVMCLTGFYLFIFPYLPVKKNT